MLDELHYLDNHPRRLHDWEQKSLRCLKERIKEISINIESLQVLEMNDGGMGSLRFVRYEGSEEKKRSMGNCLSEIEFNDEVGTPILVSLNSDLEGHLFELDIWRLDFNPVINYPSC
jgi:hypothetical protein